MLLIVLLGVYIGRTGVAAPKQYRKTVQQQEVEPQIYESGYRLCLENTSKIFTIFVGSHEY